MSIFKNLGKSLKKAAPLIGAGIGYYFGGPLMGAQLGTALGAGIGTLAGGGDIEDALLAGALGYGAGSLASSAGIGMAGGAAASTGATAATQQGVQQLSAQQLAAQKAAEQSLISAGVDPGLAAAQATNTAIQTAPAASSSVLGGIGEFMADNKMLTASLGTGVLGLLASDEEVEQQGFRYPDTGPGKAYETKVKGPITGATYNLANEDEIEAYNEELLQLRDKSFKYEAGGEVNGPGTGTSDSVPARLSDGEFVLTARAVRGAGNGDRDIGAARMYDMMAELESMA
jgi:hypothetical protein